MSVAATEISFLGAGLGYRNPIATEIRKASNEVDFLEVIAENYTNSPDRLEQLTDLARQFPIVPHGVGLSIGTLGDLDREHVRRIKRVSDAVCAPFYSDHLCMTRVPGIDLEHLGPLWFSPEVLQSVCDHVKTLQDELGKPLVLENITYMVEIPGAQMTQLDFLHRLVDSTGCGILLDVTNVYINSVNHRFDPLAFIEAMPLDHVVQVHLAGGYWEQGVLIDRHSHPVPEEVWDLYTQLCSMTTVKAVVLEHDTNFPDDIRILLDQVSRARRILKSPSERGR